MTIEEVKAEMLKVKIPWFIKVADKFWFSFGRWLVIVGIVSLLPIGILANNVRMDLVDNVWIAMYIVMGMVGASGLLMLLAHFVEDMFVKKQAARLGITTWQWKIYAKELGLKSN